MTTSTLLSQFFPQMFFGTDCRYKRLRQFWVIAVLCLAASLGFGQSTKQIKILFLGNSLTEGLGVKADQAFPYLVVQSLQEDGFTNIIGDFAGISGSTTASGLTRLDWHLKSKPDILFLALGANDGLRGNQPKEIEKNLKQVVNRALESGLDVALAGILVPANYGKEYSQSFAAVFANLNRHFSNPAHRPARTRFAYLPFLLEGVALDPSKNQADGLHPNSAGHQIIALAVYKLLRPLVQSRSQG